MAWVTEEEYQAAKQVRAYEYLQTYQPGRLKKTRTRNEWQLQDHDSFKINEITSKWHWKSRGIGGMSALRFLMQVDGMGYTEAVKILCEQTPVYVSRAEPAPRKKPFSLPFPNDSFYRVRRYLNQRGIRDEVLDYCVQLGILYESAPYHNAVFVGMDEQGEAKYAFLRGIYDSRGKSFRMEQEGSNKQYSFCVPPLGKSHRVAVYEACIDRIRALVDVNEAVPKGTLGGFVEYEQNLSQEGSCWIYDQAICCERAVVERSAGLFQEAIAKGDALLTGTAVMYQTSIAEESCRILAGEVWNMAHIRGFAKITAAKETGDAPLILGNSLVFGNVCGKVLVRGNVLPSRSVENQTQELLVFRGGDSIHKVNESKKKTKSKKQPER